jgi:hypothetical protein
MIEPLDPPTPAFGLVDLQAEHGLLYLDTAHGTTCRLTLVARTERGYPRRELAAIPGVVWKRIAPAVQKELVRGMDPAEQGPKPPFLRHGDNALSPLILREVAVLFWSLMEDGEGTHIDALLNGWRQLAREERWWLYARASNPSQCQGQGWRRALYFALTDPADTRTAPRLLEIMEAATAQKNLADFVARQLPESPSPATSEGTPPQLESPGPHFIQEERSPGIPQVHEEYEPEAPPTGGQLDLL